MGTKITVADNGERVEELDDEEFAALRESQKRQLTSCGNKMPAMLRLLADAIERGEAAGDLDIESDSRVEMDRSREPYDMTPRWMVVDTGETWKIRIRTTSSISRSLLAEPK